MNEFLQQAINGLSLGAIYALIALGYTMVYGVLRFINFAHSDVMMLGAFAAYYLAPLIAPVFGAATKSFPTLLPKTEIVLGALRFSSNDLVVLALTGVLLAAMWFIVQRTK